MDFRKDVLVWRDGMADWVEAVDLGGLEVELPPPAPPTSPYASPQTTSTHQFKGDSNGTKIVAGLCGIFLGWLGVHKFVYGATTPGIIMLLITICTCGWAAIIVWGIGAVEGIIYLTKSDQDFEEEYMIGKKGWF
ncbi:TM2 domain-containing protein [Aeoliella mucimassa]|uniref:TM2 domain protein n=1 Tax=Aeoliella mucimassa TaxID=2527972 RepID=A0A518ASJ9_9BACT|nr:TM2 domain-containing protein [Aeoliella mucimassa]QDU57702.1 TM2 domain protein [Aeoliella mucimassa]